MWKAVHGLPPFALRYKRFVTEVVADRSQAFLGTDQSYRASRAIRRGGNWSTMTVKTKRWAGVRRALSHSTVWRWLSWLGDGVPETFREARRLIR